MPDIFDAIRDSDVEQVKTLLEADASLAQAKPPFTYGPLHAAVGVAGNAEIVKLLLDHGADTEAICQDTGATPLKYAIVFTKKDLIPVLVEGGADINNRGSKADGTTPLELAQQLPDDELREMGVTGTEEEYMEIVRILQGLGAE